MNSIGPLVEDIISFSVMKYFSVAFSAFNSKDTNNLEYNDHEKHLFLSLKNNMYIVEVPKITHPKSTRL